MREQNIKAQIQIELSKTRRIRLFNQPAGMAWMGEIVAKDQNYLTLENYRPVKFGLAPGSSDLIGWQSIETDIGRIARFIALEIKSARGRLSEQQQRFIDAVNAAGGRAGVARSVDEAHEIVGGFR